jgi:hypothetical protein
MTIDSSSYEEYQISAYNIQKLEKNTYNIRLLHLREVKIKFDLTSIYVILYRDYLHKSMNNIRGLTLLFDDNPRILEIKYMFIDYDKYVYASTEFANIVRTGCAYIILILEQTRKLVISLFKLIIQ